MGLTSKNYFKPRFKLHIANSSKQAIGGGWSFIANLKKGLADRVVLTDWPSADIILIPSASMISRDDFNNYKTTGAKVVLRIDNALRNSRNRNSGMTRMKEFAEGANALVYQSEWARGYLRGFLGKDGRVVHNGVDLNVFTASGPHKSFQGNPVYLYSRFSRDESKSWIRVWFRYQYLQREQPEAKLAIVGQFSEELRNGNFDFFNGEKFEYYGIAHDPGEMAQIYRGCKYLFASYHMDCFSNTYIEALCCGLKLFEPDMTGGTPEILAKWKEKGRSYFDCRRMADDYYNYFREVIET